MYTKFELTGDANVVKVTKQEIEEIHIDKLDRQIADLENTITAYPAIKPYPKGASDEVKELVDYWNKNRVDPKHKNELEKKLQIVKNLKTEINNADNL